MTVFLSKVDGGIQALASAEANDSIGQLSHLIVEGDSFLGWTYDEILELGNGEHEIEDKSTAIAEIVGGNLDEESLSELIDSLDEDE
jgi:hypothetical protein